MGIERCWRWKIVWNLLCPLKIKINKNKNKRKLALANKILTWESGKK